MLDELPMDQGWALYSWARGNDGWEQFNGLKRAVPAYVAQEVERLMEIAKEHFTKNVGN